MTFQRKLSDETVAEIVRRYKDKESSHKISREMGIADSSVRHVLKRAAAAGELDYRFKPVLPGFTVRETNHQFDAAGNIERYSVKQKREPGEVFKVPSDHGIKGLSALTDADGRVIVQWTKTDRQQLQAIEAVKVAAKRAFKSVPARDPIQPPAMTLADLLNTYIISDYHTGAMAWGKETRAADWDIRIAEQLLCDWFDAAVTMAPAAETGLLVLLGDYMHTDSMVPETPTSRHVVDTDSRYPKIVDVAIGTSEFAIRRLLEKHARVRVIVVAGNHDESGMVWLRGILPRMFRNEPRVEFDVSPSLYHAHEHGLTSLFFHHGHRRNVGNVDHVFAGYFRELYGRTKFSYGHVGHLHSKAVAKGNLMHVEQHRTLAAPDAYSAGGGWAAGNVREASVITYSRRFGETGRIILTPEMLQEGIWKQSNA